MVGAAAPVVGAPVYKAPSAIAPASNWTGFYIGAGWGRGMWNQDFVLTETTGTPSDSVETTGGGRGWLGTVTAGFDYQFASNIIIGVFGDWDWSNIEGTWLHPRDSFQGTEKQRWAWAVGGRVGWLVTPALLSYFNGGYSAAHFDQIDLFSSTPSAAPAGTHISGHTYHGWFLGGGVEYALPFFSGLFWKNEYRYASYKGDDLPILVIDTGLPTDESIHASKHVQTIRSELIYRFNWGGPVAGKGPVVSRY